MTWRFTKPLLRKPAPHCGQRGQDVGRRARSASTDSTRWMARTRANDHAARISAGSVWASSTVQSKRCTEGSSSRMLSLRHSIGHRSPFGTRLGGSKSVPYVCCYASPPPTVNYARGHASAYLRKKGMGKHRRGSNSESGMRLLRRLEKNHDGIRSATTRKHYIQIYQAIKYLSLDIADFIEKGPQMIELSRV